MRLTASSTYHWLTMRITGTMLLFGSKLLASKAIFKLLGSPLRTHAKLLTVFAEREITAKWQFTVLVQFIQEWCVWGTNGRTIQVDNSWAPLVWFGNGYDHRFSSSVEPICVVLTFCFQSYYWRIQPTPTHKIEPILADRVNLKWRTVVDKN